MNTAKLITLGLLRGSGTAAPAFSPLDITGLELWLDASDSTTLFQASDGTTPATADNDVVGYWGDKSGAGRNAIQATTGNKPLLKLNIQNGLQIARFDGIDDILTATIAGAGNTNDGRTIAIVYANRSLANKFLYDFRSTALNGLGLASSGGAYQDFYLEGATPSYLDTTFVITSTFTIEVYEYDSATGRSCYRNGTAGATSASLTAVTNAIAKMHIGSLDTGSAPADCDIAEILVYNAPLGANRAALEAYLNAKWGVY